MKTFIKMLMVIGALLMLVACGGGNGGSDTATTTATTETTETTTTGTTNLAFSNIDNAELDTDYTTNVVTIVGVDGTVTVKTNNGSIVVNGVDKGVSEFDVYNGDTVAIKVRSSGSYSTAITVRVTAGEDVDFFGVTTKAEDVVAPPPVTPSPTPVSTPTISMAAQTVDDWGGGQSTDLPAPTVTGVVTNAVYSIVGDPTGGKLTINSSTGVATWLGDIGPTSVDYSITIKVVNPDGGTSSTTFNLHVNNNG